MFRFIFCGLLLLSSILYYDCFAQTTVDLSIVQQEVDCPLSTVCYDVELSAASDFGLGSYNLKFLFDCSRVNYISSSADVDMLPAAYSINTEFLQCNDASGLGTLDFESSLAYLQFGIDYNPSVAQTITSTPTIILQHLCFEILDEAILNDPDICFDLIWVTEDSRENYVNSVTNINQDTSILLDIPNSTYNGLDETNNCFIEDCTPDDPCFPIVDADGDDVCDVGPDADPDPTNPCVPNFIDQDGDGVCDLGVLADPDPNDPCNPNPVDADNDGFCDIGSNPDPDPADPCNPSFSAPNCIDPIVTFGLSFSEAEVDCESQVICYRVFMDAPDRSFDLGSYNLRMFYDGDLVDAIDSAPQLLMNTPLGQQYNISSINDMQGGDQSGNGTLPFDDNLDILDIAINLSGVQPLSIDSTKKIVLYDLCFDVLDTDLLENPETCFDLVWANNTTIESYTIGITTVNVASSIGVTTDVDASVYNNLNTAEHCFAFDCIEGACSVLACNDGVQVSLDSCAIVLDPDYVLESPAFAEYRIDFYTLEDEFVRSDSLFGSDRGNTYKYQVNCQGNSCWGEILVEVNVLPSLDTPCACGEDVALAEECKIFCAVENRFPKAIISPIEIKEYLMECGPPIIGDIIVKQTVLDTLCIAGEERIELSYLANVMRHGSIQKEEIFCQQFARKKLPLVGHNYERFFRFPDNVLLECSQNIDEVIPPDSLLSMTQSQTTGYPYFLDSDSIKIEKQRVRIDTIQISTGFNTQREKLVAKDVDGDGISEWIIIQEAKEIFRDSIVYDTIDVEAGFPEIIIKDKLCNVVVGYTDNEFQICGSSRKVLREWSVFDWCDSQVNQFQVQFIEIVDTKGPALLQETENGIHEISFINDVMAYIEPWSCTGDYKLPELMTTDNCDDDVNIIWTTNAGKIQDGFVVDIPKNNVPVQVTAILQDQCLNETNIFFNVAVLDTIKPVASCLEVLTVSLTTDANQLNGIAQIYAEDLSGGSNDAGCDSLTYSVLRRVPLANTIPPVGTAFVSFDCRDLGRDITIALVVQDEARNRSTCEVKVNLLNKFTADLHCEDIVIDCGDRIIPPEIVGDFCNDFGVALKLTENSFISECRQNNMIREWFLDLDNSGDVSVGDPFCEQRVSFSESNAFRPESIKWPKHYDGSFQSGMLLECRLNGEQGEIPVDKIFMGDAAECGLIDSGEERPSWCETGCGLIASSMTVDTISNSNFCFQLVQQWTVIDWCTFNSNSDNPDVDDDSFIAVEDWAQGECADCDSGNGPVIQDSVYFKLENFDEDGFYTFNQIIVISDKTAPSINVPRELVAVPIGNNASKEDDLTCQASVEIDISATEQCNDSSIPDGSISWSYSIYQDQIEIASYSERGSNLTVNTSETPLSEDFYIVWEARDGCGNVAVDTTFVSIQDTIAPTPICITGVSTSVDMRDNSGLIWGGDFDLGSYDNCNTIADLQFTLVAEGKDPARPDDEDFDSQKSYLFICDDIDFTQTLDVWIWDKSSNGAKCTVDILVDHDCSQQQERAMISGQLESMFGNVLSNVDVKIQSNVPGLNEIATASDTQGRYSFINLPMGYNYRLHFEKEGVLAEGVSTLDLLLIQKHILAQDEFSLARQIIASDANEDTMVSAADVVLLRNVILGKTTSLSSDRVWIFTPADQVFIDKKFPWPFVEDIQFMNVKESELTADFIGVKIGDVNASYDVNVSHAETRNIQESFLYVKDRELKRGEQVHVSLSMDSALELMGIQFTLQHEGLILENLNSQEMDVTKSEHSETFSDLSTFSWSNSLGAIVQKDFIEFSFTASQSGLLSDMLSIKSSRLAAEMYVGQNLTLLSPSIRFIEADNPAPALFQNVPNPFHEQTSIRFSLAQKNIVLFRFYNANGLLIQEIQRSFEKGHHSLPINREDLQANGMVLYSMNVGSYRSMGKMIILD